MESRVKALGHPIHPMLIPFPIGLLTTASIFDAIALVTGNAEFARVGFWVIAAGIIGGLAAALFGWLDFFAIPSGTRAKRVALLHGTGNVLVLVLYAVAWVLRMGAPEEVGGLPFILEIAGVVIITATGWLGGELVERMGVGVDEGANLDSPNSLTGRPAAEADRTA